MEENLEIILNNFDDRINVEDMEFNETELTEQPNTSETAVQIQQESAKEKHRTLRLPLARIKTMMKLDPDIYMISQESLILITKATEMFIEFLTKEAGKQIGTSKRKTVMRRDVDFAIESNPNLCFLDGALDF